MARTAPREPSGSSTVTGASWRCSTPGPGWLSTLGVGAGAHDICISERARKAYITAETENTVTDVDTKTLATIDPGRPAAAPHRTEPRRPHDLVSLASHTAGPEGAPQYAAIDTEQLGHLHDHQRQPGGAVARSFPRSDGDKVYVAHDTGNEVSGRHRNRQHRLQHLPNPEGGGSRSPPGSATGSGCRRAATAL